MCGIFRVKRQELENRTTMSIILNALSIFCCTTIKSERIAIIWSDNRKSQYKWRFSFIKTGTIGDRFDGLRFEHKYAQQSRFQGPWDVKSICQAKEMRNGKHSNKTVNLAWYRKLPSSKIVHFLVLLQYRQHQITPSMRKFGHCIPQIRRAPVQYM